MTVTIVQPALNDTYLKVGNNAQDTNFGSSTVIYIGSGIDSTHRGLIKFDFSPIPSAAIVSAATLEIYMTAEDSIYVRTIGVYRIIRAWVETQTTWNIASTGINWGSPGGANTTTDINPTAIGSKDMTTTEAVGFKSFGLTVATVQGWINGTILNYGMHLKNTTEADESASWSFASSNNADTSIRPKLTVTYLVPAGGSQVIWWFKKWWKEQQEKQPKILLPQGVTM
jgi:hypothetical protein